ncbi:ABC transporter ATP-binding protein [Pelagibacterales bacterium SAG-MED38]|nr:ABC transporter ATP-binding protein [Pelagibacterales bacterium SAG-MED38]MBD1141783.1 ABC transporter ATP-binding protein [Pelagibacterales bacterium SAG-MED32]
MSKELAIAVNNLSKVYKSSSDNAKLALDDISLNIKKGSIFGLLGPNGAGKSTFINILADLAKKTSGKIEVLGINHEKNLISAKKLMGIVPQELNIDPFFTPYELLEIQAGLYGIGKKDRKTMEILQMLALEDKAKAYARTLSGGMRRRLLIAKAMVHDPEILILDEPTAGVDVELRSNLWENIHKLNQNGKTIIITTHYLHEAEELCNEIAIINEGKLIANDTTNNIKSFLDKMTVIVDYYDNNFDLSELNKLNLDIQIKDMQIHIKYKPSEVNFNAMLNAVNSTSSQIKDMKIIETKLEDVFLQLTQK